MCCLLVIFAFLGPRVGILFWYLFDPLRWQSAFSQFHTFLVPLAGALFLPWTTVFYVLVAPHGVVQVGGWLWIIVGVVFDLVSYSGGGYGGRERFGMQGG